MKINVNYKKYFYFLKTENKIKNHYLIENDFFNSKKIIFDILKILICKKNGKCFDECLECNLIENKDFNYFFIFDTKNSEQIKEVSKLINWASIKNDMKKKFFWIPESELLSVISSNKLLKFLEDNSERVVGFFTTNFKEKMIPTMLSRLTILKFKLIKSINNLSEEDNDILKQISFKFKDFSNNEIEEKLINSKVLIEEIIEKINKHKIDDFLFCSNQKFLLQNFWFFIEVLIIKLQEKQNTSIKLIEFLMKIVSKNKKLIKISNNYMSSKMHLIRLIEKIKDLNIKSIK